MRSFTKTFQIRMTHEFTRFPRLGFGHAALNYNLFGHAVRIAEFWKQNKTKTRPRCAFQISPILFGGEKTRAKYTRRSRDLNPAMPNRRKLHEGVQLVRL